MTRIRFCLSLLMLLPAAAACSGSGEGGPGPSIEERVEALLAEMTLDEKIEQMVGSTSLPGLLDVLVRREPWPTADNERLGIPGLRFIDGPRGVSTCFPVAMARGAAWDGDLEERVGRAMGLEAVAIGANVINAPCINLLRHPGWGRAQETYGEDPFHIGTMGVRYVQGAQRHVMADVKHYALNSIEENRFLIDIGADERTLHEVYLPHFRMCVQNARAAAVMCAYNRVNGDYCCQNRRLLTDILKQEWDFDGFVVSDWLLALRSTADSVRAGLDVEMPTPLFYGPALTAAAEDGTVTRDEIDGAVRRILRQKLRFGLMDDRPRRDDRVDREAHARLALEAARKGMVLLKNENRTLPLRRDQIASIAVIGAFADEARLGDEGSSKVVPDYAISPFQGIANRAGGAITVSVNDGSNLEAARALASAADAAVVVAALTPYDEGEYLFFIGGDRESLDLRPEDQTLISEIASVTDRCVVVIEAGSAVSMESWISAVEAILMAWYPGQEGGNAIADVLFGDACPGGKLPVTFPTSSAQIYDFGNQQPSTYYGFYHGYRFFDRQGLEPLFPFGFGLSYTEFAYANLELDRHEIAPDGAIGISLDVKNTGDVAGEEIVQVYIGFEGSAVERPVRELKAFGHVGLGPGETKRLALTVEAEDLAYYDTASSGWVVEEIAYPVYVGSSSRDIRLTGTFRIASSP